MASLLIAVIYLAFVSLGLPDSLLGSAWPTMQVSMGVASSCAGYVSMTIAFMTIISSLLAPSLIRRVKTQYIVVFSIFLTIVGLIGFSFSSAFWMLFIFAVPYGLGAGAIDAALNQYVANNYSSRVMNFLHCFYGVGAVISPNIMGFALSRGTWNLGYRLTAGLQFIIFLVCVFTLPLWKQNESADEETAREDSAGIGEALRVPGVIPTLIAFFAYCAGEATGFLWTSSYFAGTKTGISQELIASFGSLVFGGLMLGRIISGIISDRVGDRALIRYGSAVELTGIAMVCLPLPGYVLAAVGFLVIGTGMGPIYPSIQHMAPESFGRRFSAPVIGLQMASAYTGTTLAPTAFGLLQERLGIQIMPWYLLIFAVLTFSLLELAYRREVRPADR